MKKSLLALAALTAFAGAASAQSTVTLFGGIDLNMRHLKNNETKTVLGQDGIYSSRLGFRTVEDLGSGLKAGVWIEGAMTPDNGTAGGQTWARRSTVSLMGSFGELRLGRDYTPDFWNHTVFDPFGTNGIGSSTNIFGAPGATGKGNDALNVAGTVARTNNTIGYFLPGGLGGLYGQAMLGLGEGSGDKHTGFRLGYAAGPLNVAFATAKTNVFPVALTGAGGDWKRMNFGGSYTMGSLTGMAQWTQVKASGGKNNGHKQTHMGFGAAYAMGATTLKASYFKGDHSGAAAVDKIDASQLAVGFTHDLSKRTAVYGTFSRISNDAGANYRVSGDSSALTKGKDSTGFEVGVKATF